MMKRSTRKPCIKKYRTLLYLCKKYRNPLLHEANINSIVHRLDEDVYANTSVCCSRGMNTVYNIDRRFKHQKIILLSFPLILLLSPICASTIFTTVSTNLDPEFIDEIGNTTVPAGRDVKLACTVKDLGSYKVAWMLFDQSAILTVHNYVITRNPRISVSHDSHHRKWYLHIKAVQEDDKGKYMCQINTATAKTQYGYLHVVVSPNIDDSLSSSDAIVREGANLTLTCRATGSPPPSIRWKRDDGSKITINKTLLVSEWEGNKLEMTRISRLDMGSYLCIANNSIPPTVSKQIKVSVDFPPMLWIPHQLVGVPLGYSVTLECHTEAHPTSLNYWTRDDNMMLHETQKYKLASVTEKPMYKTNMSLTIFNVQRSDYGSYKCIAKNPRGETDGTIRLYESSAPSTSPAPFTTELSKRVRAGFSDLNNSVYNIPTIMMIDSSRSKGSMFWLNLSEIDKSEQKGIDSKEQGNLSWPLENDAASLLTTEENLIFMWVMLVRML